MKRKPNSTLSEMKAWIRSDPSNNWNNLKKQCFNNFLRRNMDKFRETGSLKRRFNPAQGRQEISLSKVRKIKRLGLNKINTGTRKIAARVQCDPKTVAKYLRKAGAKRPYHRRKVQLLTQNHMEKRVRYVKPLVISGSEFLTIFFFGIFGLERFINFRICF